MRAALHLLLVTVFACVGCGSQGRIGSEEIDRGLVALAQDRGVVYVGWRLLASDPADVAFNLYRSEIGSGSGEESRINQAPITGSTNYLDRTVEHGRAYNYRVAPLIAGKETAPSEPAYVFAFPWNIPYVSIMLQGDYDAQKVTVADLDGDGAYDYIIKQPDFNTDPWREPGYWKRSEEPFQIEAYSSKGRRLWSYDMGWAIEEGVWYSPFVVYDVDCDGRAEVYVKAGEGDQREMDGHVIAGPEYLAKIDGATGRIVKKVPWISRDGIDTYNYQSRNFLTVAYLDGRKPSLIMQRGTYTTIKTTALDGDLNTIWCWESSGADEKYSSQGQHGLISADIDRDGRDELVIGSAVLDDDGTAMWTTGLGHPDCGHVADIDPSRPGLEIFYGIEPARQSNGVCLVDARTGEIIWGYNGPTTHVHSQGMAADIDPDHPGMECYSGEADLSKFWLYAADGELLSGENMGGLSPRAAWWDADQLKEVIIRDTIMKYRGEAITQIEGRLLGIADCLGDWREEIITSLPGELRIYSTTIPADTRRACLMQDRQYRLGVAAGSMGYYYPPQLGGVAMP